MLYPKDLMGITDSGEEAVFLNGRRAYKVKLHMVQFTEEGMRKIGRGILDVSARYGLPYSRIKELMTDSLYCVPPNPGLYFLFQATEIDATIHVGLPRKFWRFSELAHEQEIAASAQRAQKRQSAA